MTSSRKTTDAIKILHDRFIAGRPEAEAMLAQARERLGISMRLHELREKEGLTQEDVAVRAGTSRTVIARLERPGYEGHTMSTLRKIAGAMGYLVKVEFVPVGGGGLVSTATAARARRVSSKRATTKKRPSKAAKD